MCIYNQICVRICNLSICKFTVVQQKKEEKIVLYFCINKSVMFQYVDFRMRSKSLDIMGSEEEEEETTTTTGGCGRWYK